LALSVVPIPFAQLEAIFPRLNPRRAIRGEKARSCNTDSEPQTFRGFETIGESSQESRGKSVSGADCALDIRCWKADGTMFDSLSILGEREYALGSVDY